MISTRQELKNYIKADRERQPITHPFLAALTYSESWSVRRYLTILRNYEYHLNRYNIIKENIHGICVCGGGENSYSTFSLYVSILLDGGENP